MLPKRYYKYNRFSVDGIVRAGGSSYDFNGFKLTPDNVDYFAK